MGKPPNLSIKFDHDYWARAFVSRRLLYTNNGPILDINAISLNSKSGVVGPKRCVDYGAKMTRNIWAYNLVFNALWF